MLFAFISRMEASPWGGSEELWSQAALRLQGLGHDVVASVRDWKDVAQPRLKELEAAGVVVCRRTSEAMPLWQRGLRRLPGDPFRVQKADWIEELAARKPDFVVISDGTNRVPSYVCNPFIAKKIPFAIVLQAASEAWWPTDAEVNDTAYVLDHAEAVYFVSEGNRELARKQYVKEAAHTEVVRNPFNVDFVARLPWPDEAGGVKFAFVGRLEPGAKGCDILLDVLSGAQWRTRKITVTFYGEGNSAGSVKKYASALGLGNVRFHGHAGNVMDIWKENHVLLLPSRYEGLPLAAVEAMLCGRPCVVTDVGGSAELIEDNATGFVAEAATVRHFNEAMERAWNLRAEWREIGEKAGAKVRAALPRDPAGVFAEKLIELALSKTQPDSLAERNLEPVISR